MYRRGGQMKHCCNWWTLNFQVKNVQAINLIVEYIETKGTIVSTQVFVQLASNGTFTYALWCY